jgi:predicted membrane-bound spermidine synthase
VARQRIFFLFFLISGFCGLLYEVVWARLAMASFGVTMTVISVVLSVFMAGLALGSWLAGWPPLLRRLRTGRHYLRTYALVELGIGTGAFAVPFLFDHAREMLLGMGESNSSSYHLWSAVLLSLAILPWATLMGTTYAFAMGALRAASGGDARGFSYLYLANVLGAALGTLVSALVLIELLGFRHTLFVAAAANALVAALAWTRSSREEYAADVAADTAEKATTGRSSLLWVLFATGFVSMGLELVWTRLFSKFLGTYVYSFAGVLAAYLVATYVGSSAYRRHAARGREIRAEVWWALLAVFAILPLASADPRLWFGHDGSAFTPITLVGIVPFCAALGYVTPYLVDRYSAGDPGAASRAYSVNVIGCILGPLAAGYVLLPMLGERGAIAVLTLVPVAIGAWAVVHERRVVKVFAINVAIAAAIAVMFHSYVENFEGAWVRRDHVATSVAYTDSTGAKRLNVNGVGMTSQTSITKVMAHFPLSHLAAPPKEVLGICFGMGTTFRSLRTWDVKTTVVELVPSVPELYDYYIPGGSQIVKPGVADVVIDDGRRFLSRTRAQYDLITIDPPPPVEAAGSSLLYSREFYRVAKSRLAPGGILQTWLPTTDPAVTASVVRSLTEEFPYVRAFGSFEGWGIHFMASMQPTPHLSAAEMVAHMPAAARADLPEWLPKETAESLLAKTLANELDPQALIAKAPGMPALTDDRATNEYFLLRTLF